MTNAPLPGVATSSKGLLLQESNLLMVSSDGFDSTTYTLIEDLEYDISKPPSPGHVTDAKPYRPNDMQKKVQK